MVWLASYDDVVGMHFELVRVFAEEDDPISPAGIKNDNLLHSACERPNTGIGQHDKYVGIRQKVSALFHSLTKNHAFHNGNKRTALVCLITCLYRNDYRLRGSVSDDDVYNMVVEVTKDTFPAGEYQSNPDEMVNLISDWIKANTERSKYRHPSMKVGEFIECCRKAGATVRTSKGGSWLVSTASKSIRLSMSTNEISGPVVRRYLSQLSLNLSQSGIDIDEFLEGVSGERQQIHRYMHALRRLAKT